VTISFIITSYNIEPYIRQCLDSLRPCLSEGDQVILVDDGSTDGTERVVRDFIDEIGFGNKVRWTPVWLGSNTVGGVGIGGNIGMDHAECDTLFFVDGDDYMIPEGFREARRAYEARPTDISIANYLEYDHRNHSTQRPADASKWSRLSRPMDIEATRLAALDLIAVPWRKFYRAAFLRRHRIRFPEGDFFFEDNPFHWQVCLQAESIGFSREIVCHHRVNRPGQTMESTGVELMAFFTHYRTITSAIPRRRSDLRLQATRWLVSNMSWQVPRLRPAAFHPYAMGAKETLQQIRDAEWLALSAEMSDTTAWQHADRLRAGGVWEVVEAWHTAAARRELLDLREQLNNLACQVKASHEILQAQQAIDEFVALKGLLSRGEDRAADSGVREGHTMPGSVPHFDGGREHDKPSARRGMLDKN